MTPYSPWERTKVKILILGESQNWRCCYCGIRCETEQPREEWNAPSCEHFTPLAWGGLRTWDNEVMACRLCNSGRGRIRPEVYLHVVLNLGRWKAFKWAGKMKKQRRGGQMTGTKSTQQKNIANDRN